MKVYFTFGQGHTHRVNDFTWDKDVVCAISARTVSEAREKMFDAFGAEWAFQYDECPDIEFFPRGLKEL
jgi:hypothetical protein